MDLSLFLAQAFGLYLVIGGVSMLVRPKVVNMLINTFSSDDGRSTIMGFWILILGIPLVLVHSVWDGASWQTLVSLLAWATFLKGFSLVMMPNITMRWAENLWRNDTILKSLLVLMVILGAYLLYVGFGM